MRLDDDFEDFNEDIYEYKNDRKKLSMYGVLTAAIVILGTIICVVLANTDKKQASSSSSNYTLSQTESEHQKQMESQKSVNELLTGSTLTAQDLDFWDDYPDESKYNQENADADVFEEEEEEEDEEETDPSTDGKHTLITYENGKEEWVEINQYLDTNNYNFNNLVYQAPLMKYYENNQKKSYVGLDISKSDDYVDFYRLKNAGIDYVMIRLGQRGYYSGEISIDDNFEDNLNRASEAGLGVGVYFYSQAVTIDEAVEEAMFVLDKLYQSSVSENGFYDESIKARIKYPVVFYMAPVNDEARTDNLTQMGRTNIAMAFMDTIKEGGYSPMLYGSKEWLIKKYSLGTLDGYDIWLDEPGNMPTFPYEFQMWNYAKDGRVNGISSDASLSISFVDYSIR